MGDWAQQTPAVNLRDGPDPSVQARAQSAGLSRLIRERIAAAGGWLPFAEYMHLALYAPGLGYYAAGARKFGAAGDFVTAPELTPLFGRALARQVAPVLAVVGGDILELGAGTGQLAVTLLAELERLGGLPAQYLLLEVSAELRQRQREVIARHLPQCLERVMWLDTLPQRFNGVVLANEVLDALPVHLLHWRAGRILERGVANAAEGFAWEDRPLIQGRLLEVASRLPVSGEDYLSEICLAAPALVTSLADGLERGVMLFFDYGFPRAEYYHPDRARGTLMCHHRHRAFDDPFHLPGLTDITAHVDFTAVADAALEAGLDVLGYVSQAHFLVNAGILELLGGEATGSVAYMKQASALHTLIQPGEMGELFKVIALGRHVEAPLLGFASGDRRHRL